MNRLSSALLALTLFSAGALAVTNPYQLTTEAEVPALHQQTLPDFWRDHAIEGVGQPGLIGEAHRVTAFQDPRQSWMLAGNEALPHQLGGQAVQSHRQELTFLQLQQRHRIAG